MTEVPIIETSPLIYKANQWTRFYMIGSPSRKSQLDGNMKLILICNLSRVG